MEQVIEVNTKIGLELLKELATIQSYSEEEGDMIDFIIKNIEGMDLSYTIDFFGNILITKGQLKEGEYYPCLIAHMDTVFKKVDNYKLWIDKTTPNRTKLVGLEVEPENSYFTGTGFDDKNGIWIALTLLNEFPNIKVVFTVQEEVGAVGAANLDMNFFKDVAYVLEGDRRGNSDVIIEIYGKICSDEFIDNITPVITKYGYSTTHGMLTDISALKENGLDVSCINYSVGYYEPHSAKEYCIFEDLVKALNFARDCINKLGYNKQEHTYKAPFYNRNDYYNYGDNYYDFYSSDFDDKCTCSAEYLVDLSCTRCNPIILKLSGLMCSCGAELEEREHSHYCPFCNKHFIYDYRR